MTHQFKIFAGFITQTKPGELKMTKLHALLKKLGACQEAIDFANGKELIEAWETCERPDWMLWLCAKMIGTTGWPTHQQVVLCACDCAETVLPIFEEKYPKESSPRVAIETARKWVNGEASLEEVRDAAAAASYAAYAAYAAAYAAAYDAAYAASYAAYAATNDAAAAYAAYAAYAADAATDAADAAARAAYRATLSSRGKELADLIRQQLTIPERSEP